ncbi:MAG: hypothetical protein WDO19_05230 [Bacteroidota bacterium]
MENTFSIPQTPFLKNTVCSFWQTKRNTNFQTESSSQKEGVEIIFNFSDQYTIHAQFGERQYSLPKCFINGFNTRPIQISFLFTSFSLASVSIQRRLKIFSRFLRENSQIIQEDLTLIDGSIHSLWHQLAEQDSFDDKVSLATKWLFQQDTPGLLTRI